MNEFGIRDVSRFSTREWIPPIGAMGGPPAHELYRDLVLYAGLRLCRDREGNPCVAMRDGEHRRTFLVPSDQLREALDRFRMRRNLRPVPEAEMAELTRIVRARASDPDISVPTFDVGELDPPEPRVEFQPTFIPTLPQEPQPNEWEDELDSIMREVDEVRSPTSARLPKAKVPSAWNEVVGHSEPVAPVVAPLNASISGARMSSEAPGGLPRYLQVLRSLVRNGAWLGTTSELSSLTGDKPEKVFSSLMEYRSDLAGSNIVIAPVQTKEGWRWLAVDRSRVDSSRGKKDPPSEGRRETLSQ
jgi:hypothetical protein